MSQVHDDTVSQLQVQVQVQVEVRVEVSTGRICMGRRRRLYIDALVATGQLYKYKNLTC